MKAELRSIVDQVLEETGIGSEQSLNAIIGNKTDFVIDLKNEVINSPEHYVLLWTEGFKTILEQGADPSFKWLFDQVRRSPALKKYLGPRSSGMRPKFPRETFTPHHRISAVDQPYGSIRAVHE